MTRLAPLFRRQDGQSRGRSGALLERPALCRLALSIRGFGQLEKDASCTFELVNFGVDRRQNRIDIHKKSITERRSAASRQPFRLSWWRIRSAPVAQSGTEARLISRSLTSRDEYGYVSGWAQSLRLNRLGTMRISKAEMIAGHPALTVRGLLRRYRVFDIDAGVVVHELGIDESEASELLLALESLGLIESAESPRAGDSPAYSLTIAGNALANASAAKPIRRSTGELALSQFMTRLDRFNGRDEYVYRVISAVLFGSMLSDAERLGDVDIAIELEARVSDEQRFHKRCDERRKLEARRGTHFRNTMDWVVWPRTETFRALQARSRALSLHEWDQIVRIPGVRYRVLYGDPQRIAGMIPAGECVDALPIIQSEVR